MCTLTVFAGREGVIVTHNRDENYMREPAMPPAAYEIHGKQIIFPKDGRAGGTWIAGNSEQAVCILNGAFEKHQHLPPYRKSRGVVLLDSFEYASFDDFAQSYDFAGIEPFTMVFTHRVNGTSVLRWDGEQKHRFQKVAVPLIESSATLYDPIDREKRKKLFLDFLKENQEFHPEKIMEFHLTGNIGDKEKNFIMERENGVKTLSVSQIVLWEDGIRFQYKDLISNTIFTVQ